LVVTRRTATVAPLRTWPEAIAQLAEVLDDLEALGAQLVQLIVEHREASEQLVALDLQLHASPAVEAGRVPQSELAVGTKRGGGLGHGGAPSGSAVSGPEAEDVPTILPRTCDTLVMTHRRRIGFESTPMGVRQWAGAPAVGGAGRGGSAIRG